MINLDLCVISLRAKLLWDLVGGQKPSRAETSVNRKGEAYGDPTHRQRATGN